MLLLLLLLLLLTDGQSVRLEDVVVLGDREKTIAVFVRRLESLLQRPPLFGRQQGRRRGGGRGSTGLFGPVGGPVALSYGSGGVMRHLTTTCQHQGGRRNTVEPLSSAFSVPGDLGAGPLLFPRALVAYMRGRAAASVAATTTTAAVTTTTVFKSYTVL